jgi:hypothetical protein
MDGPAQSGVDRAKNGANWIVRAIFAAIVVAAIWIVPTYIPIINRILPNLYQPQLVNVRMDQTQVQQDDSGNAELPTGPLNHECEHIPFLLRPIASPPGSLRVHVWNEGTEVGYIDVRCPSLAITNYKVLNPPPG